MKIIFIFILLIAVASAINFQYNKQVNPQQNPEQQPGTDFTVNIANYVVNKLASKIATAVEIFQVKTRFVKFLNSLYTTENLELLRSVLNLFVRFCNHIISYIPSNNGDPYSSFVQFLFGQTQLLNSATNPQQEDAEAENILPQEEILVNLPLTNTSSTTIIESHSSANDVNELPLSTTNTTDQPPFVSPPLIDEAAIRISLDENVSTTTQSSNSVPVGFINRYRELRNLHNLITSGN